MVSLSYSELLLRLPTGKVRAVLDTDTFNEIDDQFALTHMILSPERIDLEAIYAAPFYNDRSSCPADGMQQSYDEILRLLEKLHVASEGLVYRGVRQYVGYDKQIREAEAVDDLIARARKGSIDDPLYIVAIAAISNIASAILKAPDIIDKIVVIWLGGHSFEWPDTQEFNLMQDVGGAQVLFDSGVSVVLVPCMGVTSHLHSTVAEIERYVEPYGEIGAFLAQRFKEYNTEHLGWSKEIWDMAAVGWLLNASWAPSTLRSSPIVTDNMTWSQDHSRHAIRYVHYIKRDAILQDFFTKISKIKKA